VIKRPNAAEVAKLNDVEGKARLAADRAHQARQLLDNALLVEAEEYVRQEYTDAMCKGPIGADDLRLQARIALDVLDRVMAHIRGYVRDGTVADYQIREVTRKRVA
tara:strand:- start:117 stop:434 length:318 start_codon:yes stop_codon:yes gene_type:complete